MSAPLSAPVSASGAALQPPRGRIGAGGRLGDIEAMLAPRIAVFVAAEHPAMHPGRCARIELAGQPIYPSLRDLPAPAEMVEREQL